MSKRLTIAMLLTLSIGACGGGSGEGDSSGETPTNEDLGSSTEDGSGIELFIGDSLGTGATYRVENVTHSFDNKQGFSMTVTEADAVPGSQIDIIWWTNAKDSNGNNVDTYQYDAEVYISNDAELDSADQMIFSLDCDAPMSTSDSNPCAAQGYVRCEYAESNNPTLTCLTLPPRASEGFTDLIVDISSYFSIGNPTLVSFISKLCLPNQPSSCIIQASAMTLY